MMKALNRAQTMGPPRLDTRRIVIAALSAAVVVALGACGGGRQGGDGLPMRSLATQPSLSVNERDRSMQDMQRDGAAVRGEGRQLRLNGANE